MVENDGGENRRRLEIMIIETEKHTFEVELCGGAAARNLVKTLPLEISMSRWGDEFYGTLKEKVDCGDDTLGDVFEIGDVALWPAGNALCIFFGPTPASTGSEPRMASPGVLLGKIKGDAAVLRDCGRSPAKVRILP
jgi:hypothetical protein